MHYVCKQMKAKDETFPDHVKALLKKMTTRATDLDIFKAIATELNLKSGQAKSALAQVHDSGEPKDKFMDKMDIKVEECCQTSTKV